MDSNPPIKTEVKQWLDALPDLPAKEGVLQLRDTMLMSLPAGFEEGVSYGMLCFCVPFSLYPSGYHCNPALPLPFVSLALQKKHIAIYHMGLYADSALYDWFLKEHQLRVTTKADIGKSCIRYGHSAVIPLELIGELMTKMSSQQWIELYEATYKKQANKR